MSEKPTRSPDAPATERAEAGPRPAFKEKQGGLPCLVMLDGVGRIDRAATIERAAAWSKWDRDVVAGWWGDLLRFAEGPGPHTVFKLAQVVKGCCENGSFAHDPGSHSCTLWMAVLVANVVYVRSDFESTFDPPFENCGRGIEEDYLDVGLLALHWEEAWRAAKYGEGERLLSKCARLAKGEAGDFHANPRLGWLLATAARLVAALGKDVVVLPQEDLSEVLGVSQRTVSTMIAKASDEGWLARVGDPDHLRGIAASYRFHDLRPKSRARPKR